MATTLAEVYKALRDHIDNAVDGLRVKRFVPGDSNFPVAFLEAPTVDADGLALDSATVTLDLVVLVSAFDERRQTDLLKYQDLDGPHSLLAVIQANRDLGFDDVDVNGAVWRPLAMVEMSYYRAYGAALTLTISLGDC